MTNTQVRMICGAIGALGGCLLLGLAGIGLAITATGDPGVTICRIIFPVAFLMLIVSGVVFLTAYVLSRKETGQAPPPPATRKTNGLAIASLVLGITSIALCLGCVAGIPAIICGHLAMKQIAARGQGGAGMAKAGLIIGYIITILSIVIAILMAVGLVVPPWAQMPQQMNMAH